MNDPVSLFAIPIARFGAVTLTLGHLVLVAGVIIVVLLVSLIVLLARASRARAYAAAEAEQRMRELTRTQAELHGRLGTMAEIFGSRQAELTKALSERLDGMTSRLGNAITDQT